MRMWMLNPKFLCKNHLLGEHGEIHKHRHNFVKKHNVNGRVNGEFVQIEILAMKSRHDELTLEMERRFKKKYDSDYEMPDVSYLPKDILMKKVDIAYNMSDLMNRCPECRKRIEMFYNGELA